MLSIRGKRITIGLMVVLGTCMHFVLELIPYQPAALALGNFFPVNETCWEHMKMIWYPFLTAGIILSCKTRNSGHFGAFVLCAVLAMLIQQGAFAVYQSFTDTSVLALDVGIYLGGMVGCILLAFELAQKTWARKLLPFWAALALLITAAIIYLTHCPGHGYVFLDNEGLHEH